MLECLRGVTIFRIFIVGIKAYNCRRGEGEAVLHFKLSIVCAWNYSSAHLGCSVYLPNLPLVSE